MSGVRESMRNSFLSCGCRQLVTALHNIASLGLKLAKLLSRRAHGVIEFWYRPTDRIRRLFQGTYGPGHLGERSVLS